MFEEEAEEYADNTRIKDKNTYIGFPNERISELQDFEGNYIDISERIIKTFKDASEFGYNKANEWNYVKGGIFPKDEKDILCLINFETYEVGYYHQEKRCFYTIDGREIDVIAWKEIILPKEMKENADIYT